jgi:hypothetical protein
MANTTPRLPVEGVWEVGRFGEHEGLQVARHREKVGRNAHVRSKDLNSLSEKTPRNPQSPKRKI